MATSPVGGTGTASALAQVGSAVSLPNTINAGQSFSVVNAFAYGPLTVALGSMGAGYGGTGESLSYQESAKFIFKGGTFLIDLLNSASLGNGFDSAKFQIVLNGNLLDSVSFYSLVSAQAFFSNHLIGVPSAAGPNDILVVLDETMGSTMSGIEGFSFDYAAASTSTSVTPLPSSWTMMLLGLAGLGFISYRGTKKNSAAPSAA